MARSSKTSLDFEFKKNIQPIIKEWAKFYGFNIKTATNGKYTCKRGSGIMMCAVYVEIKQTAAKIHLEAWLEVDLLTEFASLFMAPRRSELKSKGALLWREKEIGRSYVNPLLAKFKQPCIE
jgi:hypothetical protein